MTATWEAVATDSQLLVRELLAGGTGTAQKSPRVCSPVGVG